MDAAPIAPDPSHGGARSDASPQHVTLPPSHGRRPTAPPAGGWPTQPTVPVPAPARTGAFSRVRARWLPVWAVVAVVALMAPLGMVEGILGAEDADEAVGVLMYLVMLAWVWLMVGRRAGVDLAVLYRWPRLGRYWAVVAGVFVLQFLFSIAAISLTDLVVPGLDDSLSGVGTGSLLLALVGLVILPPLVEETVFRGVLVERFTVKWRLRVAILVSGVLFAILHVDPVGALMFGVVTALLYLRTGSLWPGILLHATNNLLALASMRLAGSGATSDTPPDTVESLVTAGVLLLVSVPLLAWFIHSTWPRAGRLTPYQRHELSVGLPARSVDPIGWSGLPERPLRLTVTSTHLVVGEPGGGEAIAVLPLESIGSAYVAPVLGGEVVVVLLVDGSWTTLSPAGGRPSRSRDLVALVAERVEQARYRRAVSESTGEPPATSPGGVGAVASRS